MADIRLEDILAGRHLSPYTLGEFEEHLVHVQHSTENLYFYFWLSDYTKQYRDWQASFNERKESLTPIPDKVTSPDGHSKCAIRESLRLTRNGVARLVPMFVRKALASKPKAETTSQPGLHLHAEVQLSPLPQDLSNTPVPEELMKSFESLQSFILPPRQSNQALHDFEFELNISQQLKDQFRLQAEHSLDPEIFFPIKKEVTNMLSDSMRSWLMDCSGNSDKYRAQLTLCIGAFCVIVAVIGTVLLMTKTTRVKITLCLSPLVWIGLEIFFCGVFRTCPLIFMFGSFRQIHFWELGRAKEAAAITERNLVSKRHDFHQNQSKLNSESGHGSLTPSEYQRAFLPSKFWDSGFQLKPSDGLIVYGPDDRHLPQVSMSMVCSSHNNTSASSPMQPTPCSPRTQKMKLWKQSRSTQLHGSSAPMFGPLTKVLSPVAIKSHRLSILKSIVLATLLTAAWILICLLVHTRHIPFFPKVSPKLRKE
ncbi:hypothetical protein PGT21_017498 [Puccinia graminis f. sp. tritici]|uniref:RGS domain-containing protein n=1 Tax=Puccinia graminis f. sp. tritici TaxID=56615 RepID=A0A5B0NLY3_PUCGR|nr:hypothetical protein PGT21_017498 [Puccinia graminis f. sp. tritici]KAA1089803.1 hypothetical protein PGTUg99_015506 [Puccinia graminis f. sp. tritici]